MTGISTGQNISNLQDSTGKYKELATGILLQYADSEMAGATGYAASLSLPPTLAERVQLARIAYEKFALAEKTYELVGQTGINVEKYIASQCFEARLQRNVSLGFRRASGDKRVNALMYPIEGWSDLTVFTYLMSSMACLQLDDFSRSSLSPWAQLAAAHLPVEVSHRDFGLDCIKRLALHADKHAQLKLSMNYWYSRVAACFGPPDSERNVQYIEFGLKTRRNEELSREWQSRMTEQFAVFGLVIPA